MDTIIAVSAIYSFVKWLILRKEKTIIGGASNREHLAGLVEEFLKTYSVPDTQKSKEFFKQVGQKDKITALRKEYAQVKGFKSSFSDDEVLIFALDCKDLSHERLWRVRELIFAKEDYKKVLLAEVKRLEEVGCSGEGASIEEIRVEISSIESKITIIEA